MYIILYSLYIINILFLIVKNFSCFGIKKKRISLISKKKKN